MMLMKKLFYTFIIKWMPKKCELEKQISTFNLNKNTQYL